MFNDCLKFRTVFGKPVNFRSIGNIVKNGFWKRIRFLEYHAYPSAQGNNINFRGVDIFIINQNPTFHAAAVNRVVHPVK